ncbi:MAG: hypothetical protein C0614_06570 [Desulfuromonas sp.]|nr:MAG: hypothetical protein C0614_06570 [Desulfuromonas sp.]
MSKELLIAIQFTKSSLTKDFLNLAKNLKGVDIHQWLDGYAEKGALVVKTVPDIIIIDDSPDAGHLVNRIRAIKEQFPQVTLFTVSENKDPHQIIEAMKAGAAEYLVEPVSDKVVQNAIEEIRAKMASTGRLTKGKVYSFVSAKGGVGATVLAVNTAASLAMNKKSSVALLDMCFQSGDASTLLDIMPENTILDVCKNMHRLDVSLLRGIMTGHPSGLNFLAAPINPEDSEDITAENISGILDLCKKLFDHVVLDCTSMYANDCSIEAFSLSDKVFLVTDMSITAVRNTVRLFKLIRKFNVSAEKIEIVVNRYIRGGPLDLAEGEKNFEKPVYWLVPNDFSDIMSSINRGVPLVKFTPSAPFSKNLQLFVEKIQGLGKEDFRGIKGTFGKFL